MMDSVVVSIVTFNGRQFISRCLNAVYSQTYRAIEVHLLDNASTDGTVEFVATQYPTAKIVSSRINVGFAAGHNIVIRKTASTFVLALNQDAYLSPTFVETLVAAMDVYPEAGIAGGKLYSLRNAEESSPGRRTIDMTWLDIEKKRRPVCYAQMQADGNECAEGRPVFAIDGAAMLLRRSMLKDSQFEQEFFDEDFFTGKEDVDISWRAQLLGWKCLYVPSAVGWHYRTFASVDRRAAIAEPLKVGSVRNRYLLMVKNDLVPHVLRHLLHIAIYDFKIMVYVLIYERSSLKGYLQALRLLPRAINKRKAIMDKKRVSNDYMLQWFR